MQRVKKIIMNGEYINNLVFLCVLYLYIRQIPNPTTARSMRTNAKEREKEKLEE